MTADESPEIWYFAFQSSAPPRPSSMRLVNFVPFRFPTRETVVFAFSRMMSSVVNIRCVEDDIMTISFVYEGKQRRMQRSKMELLGKALARIGLSVSAKKRAKKTKVTESEPIRDIQEKKASLWYGGSLTDENLPNKDAWKDGSILKIGDQSYPVELNPPTILSLLLPTNFMSGFPIFPIIELDFAEKRFCCYRWFKSTSQNDTEASSIPASTGDCTWEAVGTDFCYTPTILEVGCFLKLECSPASAKCSSPIKTEAISSVTVAAGPGESPFDLRHLYTGKRTQDPKLFRTVCYNTLADTYTKEETALKMLYPYCPPYALAIQYRQQLLLKELIGYNADIICLQECGHKLFWNILSPALEVLGFHGLLCSKAGEVPEGEAMFFRKDKFQLCSQHNVVLQESLFNDPVQENILDKVSALPALCEVLQHRNTVAQVAVLKPAGAENEVLCVVNTHLYFKPSAPHVRLIQVGIILTHIKKVLGQLHKEKHQSLATENQGKNQTSTDQTMSATSSTHAGKELCNTDNDMAGSGCSVSSTSLPPSKAAVLFCGDFNSKPRSGVYQLLSTGHVAEGHRDWTFCPDEDEHCTTLSLTQDLELFSACGVPQFTNFTGGFKGTLDYIFADGSQLDVEAVVPLPSEEQLEAYIALPSVVLPSDHLALVCELKWKGSSGPSL